MKYVMLIHQGDSPTPLVPERWAEVPADEQRQIAADYQALNEAPGVTPGPGCSCRRRRRRCGCRAARC